MCGIVGMISKYKSGFNNKDADIFQQMLYADAIRGWDATGVFGITKIGNVEIKKQASAAGHFVNTPQYKTFNSRMFQEYQMVIGHNRKATHGEKKHADAHPFWDENEDICLVHNGMIGNYKEFCSKSTVDSAAIANALGVGNVDDVIGDITGAFAFIWYDVTDKTMYFIRNAQRPLYILETTSTFLVASEDSLAYWIAKRNGGTITSCIDLKPMTLYSISLEDRKLVELRTIEPKKKVTPIQFPTVCTTTGEMHTNPQLNDAPNSYFLTHNDIHSMDQALDKIHRGDRILVKVDAYDIIGTNAYNLKCQMLNTDRDFLKIIIFLNKTLFDELDLTQIISGKVTNILQREKYLTIYLSDIAEQDERTTINNYDVSYEMWMDERFPCACDLCTNKITWNTLTECEILIDNYQVIALCPTCSGKHKHV